MTGVFTKFGLFSNPLGIARNLYILVLGSLDVDSTTVLSHLSVMHALSLKMLN